MIRSEQPPKQEELEYSDSNEKSSFPSYPLEHANISPERGVAKTRTILGGGMLS